IGRPPTEEDVWRWYLNVEMEMRSLDLEEAEFASIRTYYEEAGLFRRMRRRFFRRHYARTVAESAAFLMARKASPIILDLGCGVGTQALFFALLGARVIALDMDTVGLRVLKRRRDFWEQVSGRSLSIQCHIANSLEFDYSTEGPIDGIFSLFAFNMMQPSGVLLDRILAGAAAGLRVAILDGNNASWLARTVPSRRRTVWSPVDFNKELRQRGFHVVHHKGGVSLPPF